MTRHGDREPTTPDELASIDEWGHAGRVEIDRTLRAWVPAPPPIPPSSSASPGAHT